MIVTHNGRPVGEVRQFIFKEGDRYFLQLIRLDLSDVRDLRVSPLYKPLLEIVKGSVLTIIIRTRHTYLLFIAPRKVSYQIVKDEYGTNTNTD